MIVNHDEIRVEFLLARARKEENKVMFDALQREKDQIEQAFGAPMEWRRLEDKKASVIGYTKTLMAHDRETWPEASAWLVAHVARLHAVFAPKIPHLRALTREQVTT
jgi:hypothetical protein